MASQGAEHRCVVVVDGEQYDLTDFLPRHPGGPNLLLFVHGRDATIAVNTCHKDPARTVYPTLRRYKIEKTQKNEEILKDKLGIPNFLLPEHYNAITDGPEYNFDPKDESLLLNKVRKRILTKEVQQKIRQLDKMFDWVVMGLFAAYFALLFFWLRGGVPWFLAAPAFALLRTEDSNQSGVPAACGQPTLCTRAPELRAGQAPPVRAIGQFLCHRPRLSSASSTPCTSSGSASSTSSAAGEDCSSIAAASTSALVLAASASTGAACSSASVSAAAGDGSGDARGGGSGGAGSGGEEEGHDEGHCGGEEGCESFQRGHAGA